MVFSSVNGSISKWPNIGRLVNSKSHYLGHNRIIILYFARFNSRLSKTLVYSVWILAESAFLYTHRFEKMYYKNIKNIDLCCIDTVSSWGKILWQKNNIKFDGNSNIQIFFHSQVSYSQNYLTQMFTLTRLNHQQATPSLGLPQSTSDDLPTRCLTSQKKRVKVSTPCFSNLRNNWNTSSTLHMDYRCYRCIL